MEKTIVHTILKVDVLEGDYSVNFQELQDDILSTRDRRLNTIPIFGDKHQSFSAKTIAELEDPERCLIPESSILHAIINQMKMRFKDSTASDICLANYWGNVYEKNMSTNAHDGEPFYMSATYFVNVPPGSGHMIFYPQGIGSVSVDLPVKQGHYYMYPVFLQNAVTRHLSDEIGTSITFNFNVREDQPEVHPVVNFQDFTPDIREKLNVSPDHTFRRTS